MHIKSLRVFVEAALRYGPPSQYFFAIVQPNPKYASKTITSLVSYFSPFTPKLKGIEPAGSKAAQSQEEQQMIAEWQNLLDEEAFDFVL